MCLVFFLTLHNPLIENYFSMSLRTMRDEQKLSRVECLHLIAILHFADRNYDADKLLHAWGSFNENE